MSYIEYEPEREAILEVFSNFKIESYCEIGYSNGHTFDLIPCKDKLAVDPSPKRRALSHEVIEKTSDDFFSENTKNFDCFFIDGDHECSQVSRDVKNALKFLNDGGIIFMHDISPIDFSLVNPQGCGNTFRPFLEVRCDKKLEAFRIKDCGPYGLGLVRKGSQETIDIPDSLSSDLDFYEFMHSDLDRIMNTKSLEEIL
tara:strand:+ start:761 stop:1357 length:597 start_codon:yes stop_codon:yes gene_type:complete